MFESRMRLSKIKNVGCILELLLYVSLVIPVLLIGCSPVMNSGSKEEPDIKNLPIYPGAEHVKNQDNSSAGIWPDYVISYDITAAESDVEHFYESALSSGGWTVGKKPSPSGITYYSWTGSSAQSYYRLELDIRVMSLQQSNVEIKIFVSKPN